MSFLSFSVRVIKMRRVTYVKILCGPAREFAHVYLIVGIASMHRVYNDITNSDIFPCLHCGSCAYNYLHIHVPIYLIHVNKIAIASS